MRYTDILKMSTTLHRPGLQTVVSPVAMFSQRWLIMSRLSAHVFYIHFFDCDATFSLRSPRSYKARHPFIPLITLITLNQTRVKPGSLNDLRSHYHSLHALKFFDIALYRFILRFHTFVSYRSQIVIERFINVQLEKYFQILLFWIDVGR